VAAIKHCSGLCIRLELVMRLCQSVVTVHCVVEGLYHKSFISAYCPEEVTNVKLGIIGLNSDTVWLHT